MNIDLLSRMVRDLLLDNDVVALPGLGSFVAEMVPSTFSDKGFTINPPYRKLYFRENYEQDDLLVNLYAQTNNVSAEVALSVLTEFLGEMKEILNLQKSVVLPELGRLRATKENNYFFVPFEDMDIYPDGLGLEPISLKAHPAEDVPLEVEPVVALDEPVEEAPAGEVPAEGVPAEEVPLEVEPVVALDEPVEEAPAGEVPAGEVSAGEVPAEEVPAEEVERPAEIGKEEPNETAEEKPDKTTEEWNTAMVELANPDAATRIVPAQTPEQPEGKMARWLKITLITLGIIIAVAIVLLVIFILLAHVAPDFIDSILYSKEELEILKY